MPKNCQHCGQKNPDSAFWCMNCKAKILHNAVVYETNTQTLDPFENENSITDASGKPHHPKPILKTFIILSIVILCCFPIFIFLNDSNLALLYTKSLNGINCQINEDFWFEGNYLNTSEGWSFELSIVKEYQLEGRILALKTYSKNDIPYDPCNIFSPIDLVIGIDDVQNNPSKYDYTITSFTQRTVSWYLYYENIGDYYYFQSHTGNNHIIPHTKEVIDALTYNISIGDTVILEGSLINLYGTRGNQYWRWTTDTTIGNYACEIILVDEIQILKQ